MKNTELKKIEEKLRKSNTINPDEIVGVVVYNNTEHSFCIINTASEFGSIRVNTKCEKNTIVILSKHSVYKTNKGFRARGIDTLWHRLYSVYLFPIKSDIENEIRWMADELSIEEMNNILHMYNSFVDTYNERVDMLEKEYNMKFDRLDKRNLIEEEEIGFFYNTDNNKLDVCIVKKYRFDIDIYQEGGYLYGKRCNIPEKIYETEFEILGKKKKMSYAPSMGIYDYDDDICYYVTEIKFRYFPYEYIGEISDSRKEVYITKKTSI